MHPDSQRWKRDRDVRNIHSNKMRLSPKFFDFQRQFWWHNAYKYHNESLCFHTMKCNDRTKEKMLRPWNNNSIAETVTFWCVDKNNAEKKHYGKRAHTASSSSRRKIGYFTFFAYLNDGKIAMSFCLYKAVIKIDWPWQNCSISFTLVVFFPGRFSLHLCIYVTI